MKEFQIEIPPESFSRLRAFIEEPMLEELVNLEPSGDGLEDFEPIPTIESGD